MAAILGWGIRVARASRWEPAWMEEAVAWIVALRALGAALPSDPGTHVGLAGAIAATKRLLDGAAWTRVDATVCAGWERDRPLLDVASTVRAARLEAAWRALGARGGR